MNSIPKSDLSYDSLQLRKVEDYFDVSLQSHLGSGTYGRVFKGRQKGDPTNEVAIKFIAKDGLDEAKYQSITKEIAIMSACHHANILCLLDFFETESSFAVVTELCSGGDLFDYLYNKVYLPEDLCSRITREIAEGVAYLHDHHIVHRDLKLENVMFKFAPQQNSPIKIVDFGFARYVSNEEVINTPCGTPGYIAPEVAKQKSSYGKAVDIWSIGVILYIMLVGFPPFYSNDDQKLLQLIAKGRYSFPRREWRSISLSAQSLVRDLLKKNPTKRLTAAQIINHPWIQGERAQPIDPDKGFEDGNATEEEETSNAVTLQNSTEIVKNSLNRSLQLQRTLLSRSSTGSKLKKKSSLHVSTDVYTKNARDFGENPLFSHSM